MILGTNGDEWVQKGLAADADVVRDTKGAWFEPNAYKRASLLWQLMLIADAFDLYERFILCLRVACKMKGPFPDAPEKGSQEAVYNIVDFPGIRVQSNHDFDVYVDVATIVMRMPVSGRKLPDQKLPCIEFRNSDGIVVRSIESNESSHLYESLIRVVGRDHRTPAVNPTASSLDTLGLYNTFVSFLETELHLSGPWPPPPCGGSDWDEYRFAAFPGIQMRDDTYTVAKIELWVLAGRNGPMGEIAFCCETGPAVFIAKGSDKQSLWSQLQQIIEVAPPAGWAALIERVGKVVDDLHVDPANAEASKTALLEIIRPFVQLLMRRSAIQAV